MANLERSVELHVDATDLDAAIEKANRLVELLREASNIIRSLSEDKQSET